MQPCSRKKQAVISAVLCIRDVYMKVSAGLILISTNPNFTVDINVNADSRDFGNSQNVIC